jgi:hypothetical protein
VWRLECFWRRRLMVWLEVILAPLGRRTVIWTSVLIVVLAGASFVNSETETVESMKVVDSGSAGLEQPDS